ncbi:MAG: nicotinate phosphoribosyltransferase [Deltaproteobacteria bacterium]|nr:nicotinate phosphoribosyltransferase [Deltaproteobacteria bacterium]
MMHVASLKDIKNGKVTDVYFARTLEILQTKKIKKRVKAEFITKNLPNDWQWGVLAGIEECTELLKDFKVSVRAMKEGTLFRPYQPVMEIEGEYTHFGIYETALLGFLCQASGVATRAARCKKVAGMRGVISFGARRMHPSITPMIERNAYIGGCDGVATLIAADLIGEKAIGTMPHALIVIMGDSTSASRAFDEVIDRNVNRIALVDTFGDEKFETLNVARALGDNLFGVRLDTPGSRRGNFFRILEEVRWELNLRGFSKVKLLVSGGIDEQEILKLNPLVDAYGVGTAISNAPVIDFSMDIIEMDGVPVAKRGKMSGSKRVVRCPECLRDKIVPHSEEKINCECETEMKDLLLPLIEEGKLEEPLPRAKEIRKYVLEQVEKFSLDEGK